MNKDQAFYDYIKNNLNMLTSVSLDKKEFRRSIKDYFYTKHRNKFGQPKQWEVSSHLLKFLVKTGASRSDAIASIELLPIFKDIGDAKRQSLIDSLDRGDQSVLSNDDIDRIKKMSALDIVRREQKEKIEGSILDDTIALEEERERIKGDIKRSREEFESLPSVLDGESVPEPEFNPEIEETKPWWQRFYLKANPFPGNKDGLSKIDTSLYDQVVVKTKPYIYLLNELNRDIDNAFDTAHMLVGDYGYGKTTFQEFLILFLESKDIHSIRITCIRSHSDANGYLDHFLVKLRKELTFALGIPDVTAVGMEDEYVIELSEKLCKKRKGLVIFLDDYHKHQGDYSAIYDFLGRLQILKDSFTRSSAHVGFIVSAVPLWPKEMDRHKQMSGFFDSAPLIMPDATPNFIAKVFNQRISAYCYDTNPRQVKIDFIEKLFERSGNNLSYRDYLNLIIDQLESNNMSIVSTPIEIDDAVLDDIRLRFERDPIINPCLNKLRFESKFKKFNSEQIFKCMEIMVLISMQNGISERETIFTENKYYFQRLSKTGILSKKKSMFSSSDFNWVLNKRFSSEIDRIKDEHNFHFNDYFLKLYPYKLAPGGRDDPIHSRSHELIKYRKFFDELEPKLSEAQLESINHSFILWDKFHVDPTSREKRDAAVNDMKTAFSLLSDALFGMDGMSALYENCKMTDIEKRWREYTAGDEPVIEFYRKVRAFEIAHDVTRYSSVARQAKDSFIYILDNIKSTLEDIAVAGLDSFKFRHMMARHNPDDYAIYDNIRGDLFSAARGTHLNYITKLTNHLETVFRQFLYCTTSCLFGLEGYFKHIPEEDRRYAHKNTGSSSEYSSINNMFDGFTRAQFRTVFTQNSTLKKMIFDRLDLPWAADKWTLFFDIFVEENINTSHRKGELFTPEKRSRYITYSQLAMELISSINRFLAKNIISGSYIFDSNMAEKSESIRFLCSYVIRSGGKLPDNNITTESRQVFLKNDELYQHSVSLDVVDKVRRLLVSKIDGNGYVIENISKISFICAHYGVTYPEFILVLAYLEKVERLVKIRIWSGSRVHVSLKSKN